MMQQSCNFLIHIHLLLKSLLRSEELVKGLGTTIQEVMQMVLDIISMIYTVK